MSDGPVGASARGPGGLRVIALAVQKGGTGKTTLAASLAVAALECGERVIAFDLDPQGSLAAWSAARSARPPQVDRIAPWELAQMPEILRSAAEGGATLAILDTAGSAAGMDQVLRLADLVLIPVRPSRLDILAASPTIAALARCGLRDRLTIVLNQCPPPPSPRADAYAAQIRSLGLLAEPRMTQRVDHQDALALGLGVTEYAPDGRAAEEADALWTWIDRRLSPGP